MIKGKLVIETEHGKPFIKDIEIAEGDKLILKTRKDVAVDVLEGMAKIVSAFLTGKSKFLILNHDVDIIRIRVKEGE